jgi:hypothetical protein
VDRLRRHPVLVVGGLTLVLALPLLIAIVVLHQPRWFPLLDMAQTELRVRDVWSRNPPLIGLAGRIGPFNENGGSHPGPLSFYALWPVYQLFGASAYGMQVANVVLDIAAIALVLWIGWRRGGVGMTLALAATMAVVTHAYGAFLLTLPWNPYMPVLWWLVFLLAVWSIVVDDLVMLPVAVFAGTFCMQTHIPYLGLVGGFVLGATVWVIVRAVRQRDNQRLRRDLVRYGVIAVVLGVVLWTPPVLDELVHEPGNITTIREHFSDPPETPVGLKDGVYVLGTQLNPYRFVTEVLVRDGKPRPVDGSMAPGLLLVAAWGAAAVVSAWKLRVRALVALHAVIGVALVLGVISAARIFGTVWYYLLLWAWGIVALMLLALGWTVVEVVRRRLDDDGCRRAARAGAAALGAVVVVTSIVFAVDAADVDVQSPRLNEALGEVVGPTADAIDAREAAGARGPYVVSWLPDPLAIGSQGFGLLNELVRRGYDVNASTVFRPGATRYHVMDPAAATLEIHLATGPAIEEFRAQHPDFEQVAAYDPRTQDEREEAARLREEVIEELEAAGLDASARDVDLNLFMVGVDQQVPPATRDKIARIVELGMPAAVFIGPPVE